MTHQYGTVTAYLCVDGAEKAIEFYTRAFGAEELYRIPMEDGTVGHAEIRIGDTVLMLSDEWPEGDVYSPSTLTGTPVSFVINVEDADAAFQRAVDEGATVQRPVEDAPYGRGGWVFDPFGHRWNIQRVNPGFDPASMGGGAAPTG